MGAKRYARKTNFVWYICLSDLARIENIDVIVYCRSFFIVAFVSNSASYDEQHEFCHARVSDINHTVKRLPHISREQMNMETRTVSNNQDFMHSYFNVETVKLRGKTLNCSSAMPILIIGLWKRLTNAIFFLSKS